MRQPQSFQGTDADSGQEDDDNIDWLTLQPKGAGNKGQNAGSSGIAFPSRQKQQSQQSYQSQNKASWRGQRDDDAGPMQDNWTNDRTIAKKQGQKQLAGDGVGLATMGDEVTTSRDVQV